MKNDTTTIQKLLAYAQQHGIEDARVVRGLDGWSILRVAIPYSHADGCDGSAIEYARTFGELRAILGY